MSLSCGTKERFLTVPQDRCYPQDRNEEWKEEPVLKTYADFLPIAAIRFSRLKGDEILSYKLLSQVLNEVFLETPSLPFLAFLEATIFSPKI